MEDKKQSITIRIKDVEAFFNQSSVLENLIRKDANTYNEFLKFLSHFTYPDVDKHFHKVYTIHDRTRKVMDAIISIGKKNKMAALPDLKNKVSEDMWDRSPEHSLYDMVFFTVINTN